VDRCAEMGKLLEGLLLKTFEQCKYIGDIRGRGLFWGNEFVKNRKDKSIFGPSFHFGIRAVYPGGATVDGTHGDYIPYTVTESQMEDIVTVLKVVYDSEEPKLDRIYKY
jgi:adenosylmethionine-8-amino-7-oxononanoate aminotransferase